MLVSLKKYSIILIILVASVLRLWKLDVIPPHLTSDEAALGYNAYSILKTGRDEYGQFLPSIFKSFGDYKPGLYVYFTVPSIAILGLNEFATRLPSAIAGILAIWLIYKIVINFQLLLINNQPLAITASFLLAVSPWHIHFSRGAWEANLSLTLTLLGIYFFQKAQKSSKFLVLSSLFFSLTFFAYQGAKLSTSIVVGILLLVFWKESKVLLKTARKIVAISLILGFIISSPVLFSFTQAKTGRLTVFSVFSYPRPGKYLQDFLDQGKEKIGSLSYYLFHSEKNNFARGVMGRWFNHFSGRFLFFEGDWPNPRHSAPNNGILLLMDLPLLILGLFALAKNNSKFSKFLVLWLVLAPLPSVLSRDQVHAIRALNMVVPLTLVSSLGVFEVITLFKSLNSKGLRVMSFVFLLVIFFSSLVYFLDSYFVHLPKHNSEYWEYGYKQIVETLTPIQNNYESIKVQQSFAQPYIYFLFFQKYNPAKYQKQSKLVESEYKGDVGYITKLDNIEFVPIDWSIDRGDHGSLIIGDPIRIPPGDSKDEKLFTLIKEINYLDGTTAFRIIEVK